MVIDIEKYYMQQYKFTSDIVTQMSLFFLWRESSGILTKLKLMKLLYLSDRESLKDYGYPISFDIPYAMQHGPVLTNTLNIMKTDTGHYWNALILKNDIKYSSKIPKDLSLLDELSDDDMEILDRIWCEHGTKDAWTLRNHTHTDSCPEWALIWDNPNRSSNSVRIPFKDILIALGKSENTAIIQDNEINSYIFTSL